MNICYYTTFTNFSMKYHLMCKVCTDVGGIIKLMDYLHVQADNPWYNYYLLCKYSNNLYILWEILVFLEGRLHFLQILSVWQDWLDF